MKDPLKRLIAKCPPLYKLIRGILNKTGISKTDTENSSLAFILKHLPRNGLILEIGTFTGQTTKELAKHNFVIGIDPFYPDIDGTLYGVYSEEVYKRFIKNTQNKNVLLMPMTSEKAFYCWEKNIQKEFDFIFIDGLHTYEGVKFDFNWVKYLKVGGLIAFHDMDLPQIDAFVNYVVAKDSRFEFVDKEPCTALFRKVA